MTREEVAELIAAGRSPHEIWKQSAEDRQAYVWAIEEEARAATELAAYPPTPQAVVDLRDGRNLRWERIAARVFGDARRMQDVRNLYDQAKGPGASRRSYTGRGRRFAEMSDDTPRSPPKPHAAAASPYFGVVAEKSVSTSRVADMETLRSAPVGEVRKYLEAYLYSDRLYVERNRIFLELPNHIDQPPTAAILVWFLIPADVEAAAPAAGSRAGVHAVPRGWDATLCTIPLSEWTSGRKPHSTDEISCRWCRIRLMAIELVTD